MGVMIQVERVRPGQLWKAKNAKRVMRVTARAGGNKHWYITNVEGSRRCHHIHEGTLRKFYELMDAPAKALDTEPAPGGPDADQQEDHP